MDWILGRDAFFWGFLSAVSLPLGAVAGIWFKPGHKANSAFMAFGAGALLFALTIELFGATLHHMQEFGKWVVVATMFGAVLGGFLFDILNTIVNSKGGFARSVSNARNYLSMLKLTIFDRMYRRLSHIKILSSMPPDKLVRLAAGVKTEDFAPGTTIFREGDRGDALYFIVEGEVEVLTGSGETESVIAKLGADETFGEIALLTGMPRSATVRTVGKTTVYKLYNCDFRYLASEDEILTKAIADLAGSRLTDLSEKAPENHAFEWCEACRRQLARIPFHLTDREIHEETSKVLKEGGGGAALAIWLGILIDGIPESLVIGMLATNPKGMSLAFIAGVFLANMPEAMSSSTNMSKGGMTTARIMFMWGSLTIMTGIGALIGTVIFPAHPVGTMKYLVSGIEGLAAGAMLTMIAETMLPEAFEQGGRIVGLATLAGFLAALYIKLI